VGLDPLRRTERPSVARIRPETEAGLLEVVTATSRWIQLSMGTRSLASARTMFPNWAPLQLL
jgi:hypothetical protein